jgi:hypothetical protein
METSGAKSLASSASGTWDGDGRQVKTCSAGLAVEEIKDGAQQTMPIKSHNDAFTFLMKVLS